LVVNFVFVYFVISFVTDLPINKMLTLKIKGSNYFFGLNAIYITLGQENCLYFCLQ